MELDQELQGLSETNYGFVFDSVEVIESLPSGSFKTGWRLYQDTIYPHTILSAPFETNFVVVETAQGLLAAIHNLAVRAASGSLRPILHIESHGKLDGLLMANGDCVTWEMLAEGLKELNIATRMNLLVTMSGCWGGILLRAIRLTHRAPVHMLMGATQELGAGILLDGFERFYRTLLGTRDGAAGWREFRATVPSGSFVVIPSMYFFKVGFVGYIRKSAEPEYMAARLASLLSKLYETNPEFRAFESEHVRNLRVGIENHAFWFNKYRTEYFMLDLFPENAHRFGITLQDLLPAISH